MTFVMVGDPIDATDLLDYIKLPVSYLSANC